MSQPHRRVVLVMHNWLGYLHGVQLGIAQYFSTRPEWTWSRILPTPEELSFLKEVEPDGIIAYVEHGYVDQLKELNVPIVDVSNWWAPRPFPTVLADDEAIGRIGAEHFLELGLRNFGVIGPTTSGFSALRKKGYIDTVTAAGHTVSTYKDEGRPPRERPVRRTFLNMRVLKWLQELPKPAGIFSTHDPTGAEVLEICRHSGIKVPEEICVLGVDNDELISKFSHPPLSSIAVPREKIGFEAARLLDEMMSGTADPSPTTSVLIPPIGVVTRQSTNLLNIGDPDVLAAVRHIRERVHEKLTVQKLLATVPVNRRYLERKFIQYMGRTPLQEIRRVRIEKAKEMLTGTDLAMPTIARRCGFSNPERFATVFRDSVGQTPTAYRRRFRPGVWEE